jgi:hypothetical protein
MHSSHCCVAQLYCRYCANGYAVYCALHKNLYIDGIWYATNAGGNPMSRDDTFETVYPRYEFAPLVEIAIALGGGLKRLATTLGRNRASGGASAVDAGIGHAA